MHRGRTGRRRAEGLNPWKTAHPAQPGVELRADDVREQPLALALDEHELEAVHDNEGSKM